MLGGVIINLTERGASPGGTWVVARIRVQFWYHQMVGAYIYSTKRVS